jgi:murein DD-endopeptidase MepM/ murein hydrolase activator NlpD
VTLFAGVRLGLLTWSWRRPLLIIGSISAALPFLMAGLVVRAQQARPGGLMAPVRGATLTQPFGCTALEIEPWSAECPSHHFHSGVDLAASLDTAIHAATGGSVSLQRERGGYGLYIVVTRDPQLSTLYGHLDWPLVQSGDVVAAGQTIALMGSTGNSTGPHLHFEVRIAGVPVDPLPLLENPKGGDG